MLSQASFLKSRVIAKLNIGNSAWSTPSLVYVGSFGKEVIELSGMWRPFGHAMLATARDVIKCGNLHCDLLEVFLYWCYNLEAAC